MKQHGAPSRTRPTAGYSLLEMVLSLTVLSVVFAAVGSVFVLASKVIPAPGSALAAGVKQSNALTRVAEDLQAARYITDSTPNSITFVVDDRTGDGLPDRLRYDWSGNAGDPLTLSINGSSPATVAQSVEAFSLGYKTDDRVDTVAGTLQVSEETLLYTYNTPYSWEVREISRIYDLIGIGQLVSPTLPAGTVSYTVTRVRVSAKKQGTAIGETYVRLYDTDGTLPAGNALAEEIMQESGLGGSFSWVDIAFDSPPTRLAGEAVAVALEWKSDIYSAAIEYDEARGDGLLTRNKDADLWINSGGKNMLLEVYGTTATVTPSITMTREVRTHVQVTLKVGDASAQSVTARLYREPGVHSAAWDAGFDASPEGVDMDGDGADWNALSGCADGSFVEGRWTVDGVLRSEPEHDFAEPITVDAVMGSTSTNAQGAELRINADFAGGLCMPIVVRAGRDASGQHFVQLATQPEGDIRLEVSQLGENLPRVRLLISPADNTLGLIVNDQPVGAYVYNPVSDAGLSGIVRLAESSSGVFDSVSVRVGGTAVVTQAGAP